MAHAVDAQIREQNRKLTEGREGEDDGTDWLHSDAAQRASLASGESAHCRTVISKFGGIIKEGSAVALPPQTWEKKSNKTAYLSLHPDSFRSRVAPSHVVVSAGVPGCACALERISLSCFAFSCKSASCSPNLIHCGYVCVQILDTNRMPLHGASRIDEPITTRPTCRATLRRQALLLEIMIPSSHTHPTCVHSTVK